MGRTRATASIWLLAMGIMAGVIVGGPAAVADAPGQTLVVVQGPPQVAAVDLGAAGATPGDILGFHSELFDPSGTTDVGDLDIQCTQAFGDNHLCIGIFTLDGRGQLSVDALPEFPLPATGIVTGGNGEFQRTRGEAHIEPQLDGTTVITFHLFG